MEAASADVHTIEGEELTTWTVLTDSTHVRMDFPSGSDGAAREHMLPFDVLSGLLMTLPRILQTALDARFPDCSLRFVHQLGTWRIEQSEGGARSHPSARNTGRLRRCLRSDPHQRQFTRPRLLIAAPDLEQSGMRRPN